MTYMMLEGNMVPVEILGLTSSIAIQDEMITFTDSFGQVKQYDTFFEDGHLQYVRDNVQLKICISEGGLLHVELNVLTGDLGDENAPTTEKQAKHMDANKLDEGILNEYYEKVQE